MRKIDVDIQCFLPFGTLIYLLASTSDKEMPYWVPLVVQACNPESLYTIHAFNGKAVPVPVGWFRALHDDMIIISPN